MKRRGTISPLAAPAWGVFIFWFVVLNLVGILGMQMPLDTAWSHVKQGLVIASISIPSGLGLGLTMLYLDRRWKQKDIAPVNDGVMTYSIGPIQCDRIDAPKAMKVPDKACFALPQAPENSPDRTLLDENWFQDYTQRWQETHPQYVAFACEVAKVLSADLRKPAYCQTREDLDAGKLAPGAHGDASLLGHSMTVASVMNAMAKDYSYTGFYFQRKAKGQEKSFLGLNDPDYVFNSQDPMVGLLGLCHDVGKVLSIEWVEDAQRYEKTKPRHGALGSRILAYLDTSFWKLSQEDIELIQLVLPCYHTPWLMPVLRSNGPKTERAISDRFLALSDLLILADKKASMMELGRWSSSKEHVEKDEPDLPLQGQELADLVWRTFDDLLIEAGRITDQGPFKIGQKNTNRQFGKHLVLKGSSVAQALINALNEKEQECRCTPQELIQIVLGQANQKGLLITRVSGLQQKPEEAMWRVEFFGMDKKRGEERIASWSNAILLRVTGELEVFSNYPDASSRPFPTGPATVDVQDQNLINTDRIDLRDGLLEDPEGGYILAGTKLSNTKKLDMERDRKEYESSASLGDLNEHHNQGEGGADAVGDVDGDEEGRSTEQPNLSAEYREHQKTFENLRPLLSEALALIQAGKLEFKEYKSGHIGVEFQALTSVKLSSRNANKTPWKAANFLPKLEGYRKAQFEKTLIFAFTHPHEKQTFICFDAERLNPKDVSS